MDRRRFLRELERSDRTGVLDEFDESDFDELEQLVKDEGLDPEDAINAVAENKFYRQVSTQRKRP